MTRTLSLASLILLVALAAVGCGSGSDTRKNDVPVQTGEGGVDKKGKQSRNIEAGIADPNAKKR